MPCFPAFSRTKNTFCDLRAPCIHVDNQSVSAKQWDIERRCLFMFWWASFRLVPWVDDFVLFWNFSASFMFPGFVALKKSLQMWELCGQTFWISGFIYRDLVSLQIRVNWLWNCTWVHVSAANSNLKNLPSQGRKWPQEIRSPVSTSLTKPGGTELQISARFDSERLRGQHGQTCTTCCDPESPSLKPGQAKSAARCLQRKSPERHENLITLLEVGHCDL